MNLLICIPSSLDAPSQDKNTSRSGFQRPQQPMPTASAGTMELSLRIDESAQIHRCAVPALHRVDAGEPVPAHQPTQRHE
jgi:hypothetical protein